MNEEIYDIIVIGSGPVGLAAAVHAKQNNLKTIVLEKQKLLQSLLNFPTYMKFFTSADKLEIGGYPFPSILEKPTKQQVIQYYQGIVKKEKITVKQYHCATKIEGKEKNFTIKGTKTQKGTTAPFQIKTKYVIAATGYFDNPNGLGGIPGENLPHVKKRYDDPHKYYDHEVVIIGAGNSGIEAALELYRIGAKVTLIHNKPTLPNTIKYWLKPDIENRIKEGKIKIFMPAKTIKITTQHVQIQVNNQTINIPADIVFVLTGYTPNIKQLNDWGIQTHPKTLIATLTTTYETNRHGLFLIGSAGFGKKTNAVFIENGRKHAMIAVNEISKRIKNPLYKPERQPLKELPENINH